MQRPKPLKPSQLVHPRSRKSSFNGDCWREEHKNSFNTRVSSVEGTRRPSNVRSVDVASPVRPGVDITGRIVPPSGPLVPPPLTDRQRRMLK